MLRDARARRQAIRYMVALGRAVDCAGGRPALHRNVQSAGRLLDNHDIMTTTVCGRAACAVYHGSARSKGDAV